MKIFYSGNHDYGDYYNWENEENKKLGFKKLIEIQNELGFKVLRDENVDIKKITKKLALWGLRIGRWF